MLVHNAAALNKFRVNYDIPNDVQIERFGPNRVTNLVEGNDDRIPF